MKYATQMSMKCQRLKLAIFDSSVIFDGYCRDGYTRVLVRSGIGPTSSDLGIRMHGQSIEHRQNDWILKL